MLDSGGTRDPDQWHHDAAGGGRWRAVPRSTAFSMITQPVPICTGPPSAASTAPCMMQLPAPTLTWPLRTAVGAT